MVDMWRRSSSGGVAAAGSATGGGLQAQRFCIASRMQCNPAKMQWLSVRTLDRGSLAAITGEVEDAAAVGAAAVDGGALGPSGRHQRDILCAKHQVGVGIAPVGACRGWGGGEGVSGASVAHAASCPAHQRAPESTVIF